MNELSLTAPAVLAAQVEAERYGVVAAMSDRAGVYGRIAEVLAMELHDVAADQPGTGRRPRQRRRKHLVHL